ncbi:hypothetical protein PNEG_00506 [Pneumocystis murina B123]|uniref:RING-type E3 ubiquitin transferase n=1 Tax=Pneumocystis murina (strain B123) TaxID=1069680 RepID=M7NRW4_PNEMU|nr:hypothetical protein PNEG_00506 [Pneumocystis murina B123]EMR11493.1 hypothetical protein PNEG_00506 [Pneumocystis murina B123]
MLKKKFMFNEFEICFICMESFTESSIPLCNHRICQKCSLRLRALYNNMNCAYCKTFQPNVIFSKGLMNYNDFELEKLSYKNDKLGIFFESSQLMEKVLSLLDFSCPEFDCNIVCNDWQDLKKHAKKIHEKYLCDLCVQNKKVFVHEHILFSKHDLVAHIKKGDFGNNRNKTGFKGHPDCGFCKRNFYDDDDLYKHCQEFHERCHVCDQMAGQLKHQYYLNYDSLEQHFRRDHYICLEVECLEKKFVVFGTEFDLKAHQLEVHKNNLSSKALKGARKIPMSLIFDCPKNFRNAKGKNVDTSNELQNYNEHMTRAERALKRQEENALRKLKDSGTFLGDTVSTNSSIQSIVAGPSNSHLYNCSVLDNLKDEEFPELGELSLLNKNNLNNIFLSSSFNYDSKIVSQYSVVLNNISGLFNDAEKTKHFWFGISEFSNSSITATQFVEFLWFLFNERLEEIGKVLSQIVNLIHNDDKKKELFIAWNDWKIKNQTGKTSTKITNGSYIGRNNSETFLGSSYTVNFPSLCSIEKKPTQCFHTKNISKSRNVWDFVDKKNIVAEKEKTELKMKGRKKNKKGTVIFHVG